MFMVGQLTTPDKDYDVDDVMEIWRRDGSLLREKARILLEAEGMPKIFLKLQDSELPHSVFIDLVKVLVELGDMKPKQNTQNVAQTGPQFSISITIPSIGGNPPVVIQGEAIEIAPEIAQLAPDVPEYAKIEELAGEL